MTSLPLRLIASGLLWVSVGCVPLPIPSTFPPAQSGHGIDARLLVGRRMVKGELLEVSDTAFIVRTAEGLVLIPQESVTEANFPDVGFYRAADLVGDVTRQLRLTSRFPAGIPASVMTALLGEAGQAQVTVILR